MRVVGFMYEWYPFNVSIETHDERNDTKVLNKSSSGNTSSTNVRFQVDDESMKRCDMMFECSTICASSKCRESNLRNDVRSMWRPKSLLSMCTMYKYDGKILSDDNAVAVKVSKTGFTYTFNDTTHSLPNGTYESLYTYKNTLRNHMVE